MNWIKLPALLALLVALFGCSTITETSESLPSLSLELAVEQQTGSPVATVHAVNTGTVPVAVSETFGFGKDWFGFEIETDEGVSLPYPVEVDLFERPPHRCLRSGAISSFSIALTNWVPLVGGKNWSGVETVGFRLDSGTYRIRITYRESTSGGFNCAGLEHVVRSEWIEFTVPQ